MLVDYPPEIQIQTIGGKGLGCIRRSFDQIMTEEAFSIRLKEGSTTSSNRAMRDGNLSSPIIILKESSGIRSTTSTTSRTRKNERKPSFHDPRLPQGHPRGPLELIAYVVRNNKLFTEIMTYIMVSPYSARGYGIFNKSRTALRPGGL